MSSVLKEMGGRIRAGCHAGEAGFGDVGESGADRVGDQFVEAVIDMKQLDIKLRVRIGEGIELIFQRCDETLAQVGQQRRTGCTRTAGVDPRSGECSTRTLLAPEAASRLMVSIPLLMARPGTAGRVVALESLPALVPAHLQVLLIAP